MTIDKKYETLQQILRSYGRLAIALSGGVDSAFLVKAAVETLGRDNVMAVTARAANFPEREDGDATALAAELAIRHEHLDFDVLGVSGFVENSSERCYHCKKSLFEAVIATANRAGMTVVADGANTDDDADFRPGARAVRELGVVSPLREAGLAKDEIRALSQRMGLALWDKPSFACLASRVPYGLAITGEILERVDRAERFFFELGFANVRVRAHGEVARIEVDPSDRHLFFDEEFMDQVNEAMLASGFTYAALDLKGYRTGSMNAGLMNADLAL